MELMKPPIIIVNYKTYLEGLSKNGLALSKIAEFIQEEAGVSIGIVPQYVDLGDTINEVRIPVLSQHVDAFSPGAHTGSISIEAIKKIGVKGSLINHSEKRMLMADIGTIVERLKKNNLLSVICADTASVSAAVATLKPEFVAIEPPELIGTGVSVSKAKPEILTKTISLIEDVNSSVITLCGAGITKGEDVASAIKMGMKGILVASGIVKAKDQKSALMDLADAARKSYK